MEDALPQLSESPVGPYFGGPPGRWCVQRGGGDDGIGELYLPPVSAEHRLGRNTRINLPCGLVRFLGCGEIDRLARDDPTEPEPLVADGQVLDHPQAGP